MTRRSHHGARRSTAPARKARVEYITPVQLVQIKDLEAQASALGVEVRRFYTTIAVFACTSVLVDQLMMMPESPLHYVFQGLEAYYRGPCETLLKQYLAHIKELISPAYILELEKKIAELRAMPGAAMPAIAEKLRQASEGLQRMKDSRAGLDYGALEARLHLPGMVEGCQRWGAIEILTGPKGVIALIMRNMMDALLRGRMTLGESGRPSSDKALELLTAAEAEEYIAALKMFCEAQAASARRSWRLRNGLALVYLGWHYWGAAVSSPDEVGHSSMLPMMMFSAATTSLVESAGSWALTRYRGWRLPGRVRERHIVLAGILSSFKLREDDFAYYTFGDSRLDRVYIEIRFPDLYGELSGRYCAMRVYELLSDAGFEVLQPQGARLMLLADFRCDRDRARDLRQKLSSIIAASKMIQDKKAMMSEMARTFGISVIFVPSVDDRGMPMDTWHGSVDVSKGDVLEALFGVVFCEGNVFYEEGIDGRLYFNAHDLILGVDWRSEESSVAREPEMPAPPQTAPAASGVAAPEALAPVSSKVEKRKRNRQSASDSTSASPEASRKIHWPSADFDSSKSKPRLVVMTNRHVPPNRQFALWTLTPEDFPSREMHDAFYTIFLAATVVPAYGEQGYKYYDCSVGDSSKTQKHKERLQASMGLKALGEFGMWRVFMRQEVASGGESLYVTQAVVKTH